MALCVCLTPQLCSALVGGLPQILVDTIVPSAPVPSLPGSAVTGESFLWVILFRGMVFLCAFGLVL